jgi:hypothetical protein
MQIKLLLRVYQSARGLFYNDNLGISAACLIVRVVDFFNRCSDVAASFVSEILDDWVGILHSSRVKIEWALLKRKPQNLTMKKWILIVSYESSLKSLRRRSQS